MSDRLGKSRLVGLDEAASLLDLTADGVNSLVAAGYLPATTEGADGPRFAIGESSTPLANLALEELSRTYDLPRLFPLTKYGRWQRAYPHLAVGLKRGFTFYQHQAGKPFQPRPDHANELLVAANPTDDAGDTHWFREQFDHFLVQEAQAAGVPYYDRTEVTAVDGNGNAAAAYSGKVTYRPAGGTFQSTVTLGTGGVVASPGGTFMLSGSTTGTPIATLLPGNTTWNQNGPASGAVAIGPGEAIALPNPQISVSK